ncbi:MAG: glycosyltransferase family 4 protein [Planctomycetota bacterium]|jgi:UDP-GlcNAc:undecaprenyl-phosphate GlcNAc-1-phosphate transferase
MKREERGHSSRRRPWDLRVPTALAAGALVALAVLWTSGAHYVLLVAGAAAVTWLATPFVARLAYRLGAVVAPGGRSIHTKSTPLLGGLAVALPLLVGMVALGGPPFLSLAAACVLMLAVGIVDDRHGVRPTTKLLAQTLAVLFLYWGGNHLDCIFCPLLPDQIVGPLELPLLVLWVLLVTNAINLADGLDGLGAGVCLVAALICLVAGFGNPLAAILAGALIGFWRHNLPRAKIFLGDTGSLMLGLLVAVLLLGDGRRLHLPLAIAALALPLGDLALCIARRALRGKPIFAGDRGHVHHLLLRAWGQPARVLACLLGLAALNAAAGLLFPNLAGIVLIALIWAVFVVYLLAVNRARWQRILAHRRPFQSIHSLARYAVESLRLAESRDRIQIILKRVVEDLNLADLRLRDIHITRRNGNGSGALPTSVARGRQDASWQCLTEDSDPVYEEERETVLQEILTTADAACERLGKDPTNGNGRARAHFVVRHTDDLIQVAPLVRALDDTGRVYAIVVNAARRSDLDLARLPTDLQPDIDLDVPTLGDVLEMGRIMDSYRALLSLKRPELVVVVGDSTAAVACALVARRDGIPLVHLEADHPNRASLPSAELNRLVATSIADLNVENDIPPDRKAQTTSELIPQLEQLLDVEISP